MRSFLGRMFYRVAGFFCRVLRTPACIFRGIFRFVTRVLHVLFRTLFLRRGSKSRTCQRSREKQDGAVFSYSHPQPPFTWARRRMTRHSLRDIECET